MRGVGQQGALSRCFVGLRVVQDEQVMNISIKN